MVSFPYTKSQTGIEGLVLRIFSGQEENDAQPFEVHLKLKSAGARGVGPFTELTLLERQARVTASPVHETQLISAAPALLDAGQPVFFTIGSDLPPAHYEVEVKVAAATPHWLSLSRTTPGLIEKLSFTQERPLY